MSEAPPPDSLYSPKQLALLHRLAPAWITEDFTPVADLMARLGTSQPESAWSPGRERLPDGRLRSMHDIWRAQAGDRDLPPAALCDPGSFGSLAEVMMFLDFREDRRSLAYRHYGNELASHSGTNWTGRTTVDMARFSEYSLLFASSYIASAVLREPLYSELVSAPKLVSTTWCRYLMPYAGEDGGVVSFACANLPIPGLPAWPPVEGRAQATKNRALALSEDRRDLAAALIKMERNVRDILAYAPMAVMVVAQDAGLIYFLNEPMARLLGGTVDGLRTTDPSAVFADGDIFRPALERSLSGHPPRDVEAALRGADGSAIWTLMSAHPVTFDNNTCVAFWFYDISGRKAVEEALREAQGQKEETIRRLVEAQEELKRLADRDALTGIPNRRYFYHISAHEFARARRSSSPLAILMLDIDFFKRVNDEEGHQAGDEALRLVASVLDSGRRKSDILARFGGEEFVMLLPETEARGAVRLAEKLRAAVASSPLIWNGRAIRMTVSIGASQLGQGDESMDSLIRTADEALYAAKREGRDRVVLGAPETGFRA